MFLLLRNYFFTLLCTVVAKMYRCEKNVPIISSIDLSKVIIRASQIIKFDMFWCVPSEISANYHQCGRTHNHMYPHYLVLASWYSGISEGNHQNILNFMICHAPTVPLLKLMDEMLGTFCLYHCHLATAVSFTLNSIWHLFVPK